MDTIQTFVWCGILIAAGASCIAAFASTSDQQDRDRKPEPPPAPQPVPYWDADFVPGMSLSECEWALRTFQYLRETLVLDIPPSLAADFVQFLDHVEAFELMDPDALENVLNSLDTILPNTGNGALPV